MSTFRELVEGKDYGELKRAYNAFKFAKDQGKDTKKLIKKVQAIADKLRKQNFDGDLVKTDGIDWEDRLSTINEDKVQVDSSIAVKGLKGKVKEMIEWFEAQKGWSHSAMFEKGSEFEIFFATGKQANSLVKKGNDKYGYFTKEMGNHGRIVEITLNEAGLNEVKSNLMEKQDLSKYASKLADLTDNNDHQGARLLAATILGDKKLLELIKAIDVIVTTERANPIYDYTNVIYKRIHEAGRKKFGKDEWNKNIYSNT